MAFPQYCSESRSTLSQAPGLGSIGGRPQPSATPEVGIDPPFQTVIGKFICCALAIGSGQSLGPEDPSLQMGAGIASLLGRKLKLSREKVRLIAPVGAAAGLAAAFNSPIAAVIFVIEEVIGTWSAGVLGAIVLAAVSSVVVSRWFLGSEPLFRTPAYSAGESARACFVRGPRNCRGIHLAPFLQTRSASRAFGFVLCPGNHNIGFLRLRAW